MNVIDVKNVTELYIPASIETSKDTTKKRRSRLDQTLLRQNIYFTITKFKRCNN